MKIWDATEADLPELVEMGARFHKAAGLTSEFVPEDWEAHLRGFLPCQFFKRSEAGMLGGVMAPTPFNAGHIMAIEMFWWSEDGSGMALLRSFEEWAQDADETILSTMATLVRAEKLLARRGYQVCEKSHRRVL